MSTIDPCYYTYPNAPVVIDDCVTFDNCIDNYVNNTVDHNITTYPGWIDTKMRQAHDAEILRGKLCEKYPSLQSAWDAYQIILTMCISEEALEE